MDGYYYGILDVFYAEMTTEDTAAANAVYGDPVVLGKSIGVTITPAYREGKLHASNARVRDKKLIDSYGVKITADQIAPSVRNILLGRKIDGKGVQIIKGTNEPAKVAIAFARTLDDGSKELWWLYKGTFCEMTVDSKTDGDGNIEYQNPSIEGTFVRRIYDNNLAAVVNTNQDGIGADVESGWFTKVYEEAPATPAPEGGA